MNNFEKACKALTEVVTNYPDRVKNPLSRQDVINIYSEVYPELNGGNCSPSDICWNRANGQLMTKDFQHWPHALEYIDGDYRVLGSDIVYTGKVYWRHKGDKQDSVFGTYINGIFHEGMDSLSGVVSERVLLIRTDLADGIRNELKDIPVSILTESNQVLVKFQELLICGTIIEGTGYQIYNVSEEWKGKTSYLCESSNDGTWHYYLETLDEVIGEIKRLVMFEATKKNKKMDPLADMMDALKQIEAEEDVDKKYNMVIALFSKYNIPLRVASPSHIRERYRILEDGSSIFVYTNKFKMNMCNEDKMLTERQVGLSFIPLFKSKKDNIRDTVRPWQTEFNSVEELGQVVRCLSNKKA